MKKVAQSILLLLVLGNCKSSQHNSGGDTETHNSQNALDWVGIYRGLLPCADCEGLLTTIRLKQDLTYDLSREYTGKSTETFTQSGSFQWSKEGSRISLLSWEKEGISGEDRSGSDQKEHYLVREHQLIQLDKAGKRIEGELANRYILKKVNFDTEIREKYWRLIELRGKPVKATPAQAREAHLILKNTGALVKGNGGCNSFSGGYELLEGNRIRFSKLLSTEMACLGVEDEMEFFKALEQSDNYSIRGDSLSLNKGRMAPLAKFVAVYFR